LPASVAPHGGVVVASMVSELYRQSLDRFQDLTLAKDCTHMTQLYRTQEEPRGTSIVIAHAMGVTAGPCAFLTILWMATIWWFW
jgi:hypothetical protein